MKRKKRVNRNRKPASGKKVHRQIAGIRASGDVGRGRSVTDSSLDAGRVSKKRVTMFLDADVLAWFKESGPKYQTRINEALRDVVRAESSNREGSKK